MKQVALIVLSMSISLLTAESFYGLSIGNRWCYQYVNEVTGHVKEVIDTVHFGDTVCAILKVHRFEDSEVVSIYKDTLFEKGSVLYSYRKDGVRKKYDLSQPDNDSTFEIVNNDVVTNDTLWKIKLIQDNMFEFLYDYDKMIYFYYDIHSLADEELYFYFIDGVGMISNRTAYGHTDYNLIGAVINGKSYGVLSDVGVHNPLPLVQAYQPVTIRDDRIILQRDGKYELSIYSAKGTLLRKVSSDAPQIECSSLDLAAGVYQIRLVQGANSFAGQFMLR